MQIFLSSVCINNENVYDINWLWYFEESAYSDFNFSESLFNSLKILF